MATSLTGFGSAPRARTLRACLQSAAEEYHHVLCAPQPTRVCQVPTAPHAVVTFGGTSANQRARQQLPRRGNGGGSFSESMEAASFSPGRSHSPRSSFGGRSEGLHGHHGHHGHHGGGPPLATFNVPNGGRSAAAAAGGGSGGAGAPGGCSRSPPSIVGFNPSPAHAQSVGGASVGGGVGGVRSDAGREILSILSARRQEQARGWLGSSPPARAANPVSNDLRFHARREGEAAYGGGGGIPVGSGGGWHHHH